MGSQRIVTKQEVRDGVGHVSCHFSPALFAALLAENNVCHPRDLSDEQLRRTCRGVLSFSESAKALEKEKGEVVTISVGKQLDELVSLRPQDLDDEILGRLVPPEDEELTLRCDPQYNRVIFTLGIVEVPHAQARPAELITRSLVTRMLEPPNLAG